MSRCLTQYRIFIGSPTGLEQERETFNQIVQEYSLTDGKPRGVIFDPIGGDDTLRGYQRPQTLINDDLRQCDYAVFILHDRWGSPPGSEHSSGTEEEWEFAKQLLTRTKQLREVVMFFKEIESAKLLDPGEQLKKVLAFKAKIFNSKECYAGEFSKLEDFGKQVRKLLADWLLKHERAQKPGSLEGRIDRARTMFEKAVRLGQRGESEKAVAAYEKLASNLGAMLEVPLQEFAARALFQVAAIYRRLDRSDDEIRTYERIHAQLQKATEPLLVDLRNQAVKFKSEMLPQQLQDDQDVGDESVRGGQ